MKCPKCGNEITKGDETCIKCGNIPEVISLTANKIFASKDEIIRNFNKSYRLLKIVTSISVLSFIGYYLEFANFGTISEISDALIRLLAATSVLSLGINNFLIYHYIATIEDLCEKHNKYIYIQCSWGHLCLQYFQ